MKYFSSVLCLLTVFFFSSCFEIREEVNLKSDGSGEVSIIFNLSKSKGKLKQYMKMDRVEGYRVPSEEEIEALLLAAKGTLKLVEGISYVESKSDWASFIFQVTARFDHVEALNEAVRAFSEQMHHLQMPPIAQANFDYENGKFQRLFDYPTDPDEFQRLPPVQRFLLESSNVISIYRFEKEIEHFSHKKAMVSPSGKAIMLKLPLSDLAKGKASLENSITFK